MDANSWFHIAVSFEEGERASFWINGQFIKTDTSMFSTPWYKPADGPLNVFNGISGWMRYLRVYNDVFLNTLMVQAVLQNSSLIDGASFIHPLDDNTFPITHDLSGNGGVWNKLTDAVSWETALQTRPMRTGICKPPFTTARSAEMGDSGARNGARTATQAHTQQLSVQSARASCRSASLDGRTPTTMRLTDVRPTRIWCRPRPAAILHWLGAPSHA